jgi:hypothetical protein
LLALGFGAALMAAGFFAAGCFLTAGARLTAGAFLIVSALTGVDSTTGLTGLSGCAAHSSAVSLCSPTQNPVELRPQPHFAGPDSTGVSTVRGASV